MLDLQARVHLEEVPGAVGGEQALDRARRRCSPTALAALDGDRADALAQLGATTAGEGVSSMSFWCRRWMRAVALAEVDDVAVVVGQHLHLDVAGVVQVALEVDRVVGEVRLALAPRALKAASSSPAARTTRMPLPPPPAAALITTG